MQEMRPTKVEVCRNVTKKDDKCKLVLDIVEVEELAPLCKADEGKRLRCKLSRMKRRRPRKITRCSPPSVDSMECYTTVQLEAVTRRVEDCAFHPKTICQEAQDMDCRMVTKMICSYVRDIP